MRSIWPIWILVLWSPASLGESGADRSPAIYPLQELPLSFNHALHLKNGASCVSCHDKARKSTLASDWVLPKHPECEDCHDIQAAAAGKRVDPPANCAYCHPRFEATVQRAPPRLNLPTPNIKFNHRLHVDKKVDCSACHQGLSQVTLATRAQLPKMGTCLSCHDGNAARNECRTCHLTQPSGRLQFEFVSGFLRPMQGNPLGLDHGPRYEFNHGPRAKLARQTCNECHSEPYCQSCHDSLQKPLSVHPNDYISLHPVQARAGVTGCQSCHRLQSFCAACHQRVGVGLESDPSLAGLNVKVHPDYNAWVIVRGPQHHSIQASRDIAQCISCHREETCIQCHADLNKGAGRGFSVNPHPANFRSLCKSLASRNDRPCLKCHAEVALVTLGCR